MRKARQQAARSKEVFVDHFERKYGDVHKDLPVWMATEVMTFGTLLTFYRGCSHKVKQSVASMLGVSDTVLGSWLLTLNTTRNICAHHGRLWNRVMGTKPMIPRAIDYPQWHYPVAVGNQRLFAVIMICKYCLDAISHGSSWGERLEKLIAENGEIPIDHMGFPDNWRESSIWRRGQTT